MSAQLLAVVASTSAAAAGLAAGELGEPVAELVEFAAEVL